MAQAAHKQRPMPILFTLSHTPEQDKQAPQLPTQPVPVWRSGTYLRLLIALLLLIGGVSAGIIYTTQNAEVIADAPNRITVYSALPEDAIQQYLAPFKSEHPEIEVKLVSKVTLALVEQLLAEQDDPKADVIWGLAVTSMLPLEWDHLLTSYAPQGIERITSLFRDVNEPPQWVGISGRSIVLCVNTTELTKRKLSMPKSWRDLIDPQYKGQLLILAPGQTSVGYLLIATIIQINGDAQGWEYLGKLHQNVEGHYANNASNVCQHVRSGEYPIGLTYDYRASFPDDETMSIVIPQEGIGWDMEVNALVRKEAVKPAAKVFLDWAISDSAMTQYAEDRILTGAALEKKVVSHLPVDTLRKSLLDLDIPWVAANRERIQGEWTALYGANVKLIDTTK